MRRELRDKFFAFLCFRDVHREMCKFFQFIHVHREMGLPSSRSLESTKHQSDNIVAVTVVFCNFVLRSQTCSASTVYNTFRPVCHTVVALYLGSDLANLEVLHVPHAVDHFLRLLVEWVERVILLQVGLQRFSIRMRLELMNQLLGCFLAGVVLLLNGRMGQSFDPEVNFTATSFLVLSTATGFSVLARMVEGRSRVRACSVLVRLK